MPKLTLIVAGKTKAATFQEAESEYLKRLQAYGGVGYAVVAAAKGGADREKAKAEEGARLLAQVKEGTYLVALDEHGTTWTSEAFATEVARWLQLPRPVALIIGGAYGLSSGVKQRAGALLSLSPLTFPHELARVVLLEQLYRAFTILQGKQYHY